MQSVMQDSNSGIRINSGISPILAGIGIGDFKREWNQRIRIREFGLGIGIRTGIKVLGLELELSTGCMNPVLLCGIGIRMKSVDFLLEPEPALEFS